MGIDLKFSKLQGITLIELLISVFILIIVLIPVLSISRSVTNNLKTQNVIDSALILCSNIMEERISEFEKGMDPEDLNYHREFNDYSFDVTERIQKENGFIMLKIEVIHQDLKEPVRLYRIL